MRVVLKLLLNSPENALELDFAKTKEIKKHNLRLLFSSAERRGGEFAPQFKVAPFEAFIAEATR